jgi:P27 family predicted phage terminase small subunit
MKRGKPSVAELSTPLTIVPYSLPEPLQPPSHLDQLAADQWRKIIASLPAGYIPHESAPILECLCVTISQAQKVAAELRKIKQAEMGSLTGLKRMNTLSLLNAKQGQLIASLSTKLRLTPQSRMRAVTAYRLTRDKPMRKPWEIVDDDDNGPRIPG